MHLLQSGVPFNVIALWLGHESTNTTHRYVEADLAMKEKAPARLEPPNTKLRRFHASDSLLDCVSRRFALFATFQYWGSASSSLGK